MKRKTTQIGIPYYVKDNFLTEYQGSIERLENSVEEEYIVNMKQNCYRERNYRKYFYVKLIGFCKITSVGLAGVRFGLKSSCIKDLRFLKIND